MSNRDQLGEALRHLPAARASDDFTARVLERLDEPAPRALSPLRTLALAAAVVLAVTATKSVVHWRTELAETRELDELRLESAAIATELDELRRLAAGDVRPVVYLGGDDTVDVVLDLNQFTPRLQPAVSTYDDGL